jgi:hypothetical protein
MVSGTGVLSGRAGGAVLLERGALAIGIGGGQGPAKGRPGLETMTSVAEVEAGRQPHLPHGFMRASWWGDFPPGKGQIREKMVDPLPYPWPDMFRKKMTC